VLDLSESMADTGASKLRRLVALGTLWCGLAAVPALPQEAERPLVHLLATGGTIAGGTEGRLDGTDLVRLLPGLDQVARLAVEDFINIGSSRMTPEIQLRLALRIRELFASPAGPVGVVVTHGTDSLEETAFLLDLLIASDRPVVFAAAQRPPRVPASDGPRNLLNAIRLAASPASRGMGVLVTLNDGIYAARDVRKTHSIALDAFRSSRAGPLGTVDADKIYFFRGPPRRLTLPVTSIEPRVDLITLVAGSDGHLVLAAADSGAKGIVLEVFGRGNVPPRVMKAVEAAREREVVVVFTTRTRGGRVVLGRAAREMGVVSGEDLDGLKARMLLVAALGADPDPETLRGYFRRLSGETEEPGLP